MRTDVQLPEPTLDYVQKRLRDREVEYGLNPIVDEALALIFKQWPNNTEVAKVLSKVAVLNSLFSTQIRGMRLQIVARHIVEMNIDDRLQKGDLSLIRDIGHVLFKSDGTQTFLLSFASKYCSWHRPDQFQIFDNLVARLLRYRCQFAFSSFERNELRDYVRFVEIINAFRSHFGLTGMSRRKLDKFMWYEAKSFFPRAGATSSQTEAASP